MSKPLKGIKVIEASVWAYVPSAGAALAEWGAEVVKIEPPTGDPMRGLVNAGVGPMEGIVFPWELWNRGKKGIALDLRKPEAQAIVGRLCASADVFLTSYLPPVRKKLGIDLESIRAANPEIIYAAGTGQGAGGPEADRGGYDSITFWSRGGVSGGVTPPGHPKPIGMPAGAFGDSLSGLTLAGGVSAAIAQKIATGKGAIVDGSLLGTAAWAMQMAAVGAAVAAAATGGAPPAAAPLMANPLVNTYQTSDGRWVALCMLQPDVYFDGVVRALDRADMLDDKRFATPEARAHNSQAIVDELDKAFAVLGFEDALAALRSQRGQWDVVNRPQDLINDPQAIANRMVHQVEYPHDRSLPMFTSPIQFDRTPPELSPAPEFAADTDDVLGAVGLSEEEILEAKIAGAVI
jgi:crotonobetainyl-CoA:carnitine CoA-transferase CaiB-like acyl-CoA transferase